MREPAHPVARLKTGPPVATHETHASRVFVTGTRAYKIKKPLALGFLDYSTLALRHAACREEVLVNRELAPDIYLGVRAIVGTPGGLRFAPEDTPGAIEYAVAMERFDQADTLQGLAAQGVLGSAHIRAVAERLARFHRSAPILQGGGPGRVLELWRRNLRELGELEHPSEWHVDPMTRFGEAFVRAHAEEIERRARDGYVRDGHGDLRCEHVLVRPAVRVVDRIEFDPALRHVDVAADLAFLSMDLEAQGQRWAAEELVGFYRQAGGSPGSEALRSFYAARCALVRAKVALVDAAGREASERAARIELAQRLWDLAERLCWRARRPVVLVVCGPAASGKSTLAAELARRSELAVVSSDEVRKRLAGIAASEHAGPEYYTRPFTRATYDRLGIEAVERLRREHGVIVDATCRGRSERALLWEHLNTNDPNANAVTRLVIRCEVTLETALERAARRMQSPERISDATPRVVTEQFRSFEPLDELPAGSVLTLDAEQSVDTQVAEVTRAIDACLVEHAVA